MENRLIINCSYRGICKKCVEARIDVQKNEGYLVTEENTENGIFVCRDCLMYYAGFSTHRELYEWMRDDCIILGKQFLEKESGFSCVSHQE